MRGNTAATTAAPFNKPNALTTTKSTRRKLAGEAASEIDPSVATGVAYLAGGAAGEAPPDFMYCS